MSRHRNVRNMRYEDELAGDDYGVSYDDLKSYAVSPATEAMFTYNRHGTQDHTLSSFMEESDGKEDDEDDSDDDDHVLQDSASNFKMPKLDDISAAKLQSGLETLEGIMGDNCHQPTAVDALMKFNYDVERALDELLSKGGRQTLSLDLSSSSRKKDSTVVFVNNDKDLAAKNLESTPENKRNLDSSGVDVVNIGESSLSRDSTGKEKAKITSDPLIGSLVEERASKVDSPLRNEPSSSLNSLPDGSLGLWQQDKSNTLHDLMKSSLTSLGNSRTTEPAGNVISPLFNKAGLSQQRNSENLHGLVKKSLMSLGSSQEKVSEKCVSSPIKNFGLSQHGMSEDLHGLMKTSLSSLGMAQKMSLENSLMTPIGKAVLSQKGQSDGSKNVMKSSLSSLGNTHTNISGCSLLPSSSSSSGIIQPEKSPQLKDLMESSLSSLGNTKPKKPDSNFMSSSLSELAFSKQRKAGETSPLLTSSLSNPRTVMVKNNSHENSEGASQEYTNVSVSSFEKVQRNSSVGFDTVATPSLVLSDKTEKQKLLEGGSSLKRLDVLQNSVKSPNSSILGKTNGTVGLQSLMKTSLISLGKSPSFPGGDMRSTDNLNAPIRSNTMSFNKSLNQDIDRSSGNENSPSLSELASKDPYALSNEMEGPLMNPAGGHAFFDTSNYSLDNTKVNLDQLQTTAPMRESMKNHASENSVSNLRTEIQHMKICSGRDNNSISKRINLRNVISQTNSIPVAADGKSASVGQSLCDSILGSKARCTTLPQQQSLQGMEILNEVPPKKGYLGNDSAEIRLQHNSKLVSKDDMNTTAPSFIDLKPPPGLIKHTSLAKHTSDLLTVSDFKSQAVPLTDSVVPHASLESSVKMKKDDLRPSIMNVNSPSLVEDVLMEDAMLTSRKRSKLKRKASHFCEALGSYYTPRNKVQRKMERTFSFPYEVSFKTFFKDIESPQFFNFLTPSPDDVVSSKQRSGFHEKKKDMSMSP